ncbi:hypothetical protein RD792_004660 [Penstemon davidsonii]|uniref:Uncharacterized protein n=1 Tax=Penstemon davidsonii TaxID=160366 RepID=A0ABR0DHY8_9LAMI|nr:hypothetical protein RD792_004660 [Penstemon davidsonii]
MSFFQQNMLTSLSSNFDEGQWIEQIRQTLDEEIDDETETPVTIFAIPKTLMLNDPNSFIPHQVAIGPYHHLRLELYDMERYKISAAKRNLKELQNHLKFEHLVDHLMKHELRIRATYHRPLNFKGETLAWMMAVDTFFLFEFLQVCGVKEGKVLTRVPSRLSHLLDASGNKTVCNAIMTDIMMLENQIPLFVVRMMLESLFSSLEFADQLLLDLFIGLSKELSPFKTVQGSQKIEVRDSAHFLDFLYKFIVPKLEIVPVEILEIHEDEGEAKGTEDNISLAKPSHLRQLLDEVWKILSRLEERPVQLIKRILFSKPLKVLVKLPWTIITKIPIIKMLKGPVEHMFSALVQDNENKDGNKEGSSSNNVNKSPLLEEITIPSVTQLREVGVHFLPTNEGIMSIHFDEKARKFYIPIINLDVNSEVVLRNLVAYEACSASGPLVLSRYTELMNGIIDTDVDAKFLCEKGIIINHLKCEKEVANLWNGMSKSIRLTKVPSLDKVIKDVNKYYDGRWKVKFGKFMKKYVFGSWKFLTFLATIMLLLLTSLQAFCEVYSCGRILHIEGLEPAKE